MSTAKSLRLRMRENASKAAADEQLGELKGVKRQPLKRRPNARHGEPSD